MDIVLSGGFHNSPEIKIRVDNTSYRNYALGYIEFDDMLTNYQRKRLERHFCGIKGCTCGSYRRANVEAYG